MVRAIRVACIPFPLVNIPGRRQRIVNGAIDKRHAGRRDEGAMA
jgi:hypothetical protein